MSALIASFGIQLGLKGGDEATIMRMLRAGADPDTEGIAGFSALLYMSSRGKVDEVQEILRLGANVNAIERDEWTALMFAAFRGDLQMVIKLMQSGSNPSMHNKRGDTAAELATREGHVAVVEVINSYSSTGGNRNLRHRGS